MAPTRGYKRRRACGRSKKRYTLWPAYSRYSFSWWPEWTFPCLVNLALYLHYLCCVVRSKELLRIVQNNPLFVFSIIQPLAYRLWCATSFRETMIFIISTQDFHSCSFCLFKDYIQGERHPFCLREFTNLLCLEITCHLINDLPCGLSLLLPHTDRMSSVVLGFTAVEHTPLHYLKVFIMYSSS